MNYANGVIILLEEVDLDKRMGDKEFSKTDGRLGPKWVRCNAWPAEPGIPIMVVFEGWDTTCMGKAVNDYIRCLDPRGFDLHPI